MDAGVDTADDDTANDAATDGAAAVQPERPLLVTSAQGEYWQVGEPTPTMTGEPTVVVNRGELHQLWAGFGGTFDEAGWDALRALDVADQQRALRLLFDEEEGLDFTWGRLPIGASEYALERYSLDETTGDYGMDAFSIAHDEQALLPYLEAARELDPGLRFWAVPWSPPEWMKDNASLDGGVIIDDPAILDAYALYLARYVESYAERGFTIEAVAVQNDPSFAGDYPSSTWTPELYHRFELEHLAPIFQQRHVPAKIWLGAFGDPPDEYVLLDLLGDPNAIATAGAVALQWASDPLIPYIQDQTSLPIIESQHVADNAPWEASYSSDHAPNDDAAALQFWATMHSWLEAGVNAYHVWHLVLDSTGLGLGTGTPWPKNALLVVDRSSKTLTVTPSYYVFRHVAAFVKPDAQRIGVASDALQTLAFQNPDGAVVVVLHNPDAEASAAVVAIDDVRLEAEVPAMGWVTMVWP
jgi:glucosylceramidase